MGVCTAGDLGCPSRLGYERLLLYGDGSLLIGPVDWREVRLTEPGIQGLLRAALDVARFGELPAFVAFDPRQGWADVGIVKISINAGGVNSSVSTYSVRPGPRALVAAPPEYRRFRALADLLRLLDASTFSVGEVLSVRPYAPGLWVRTSDLSDADDGRELPGWPPGLSPPTGLAEGGVVCAPGANGLSRLSVRFNYVEVRWESRAYGVNFRPVFPHDRGAATCGL